MLPPVSDVIGLLFGGDIGSTRVLPGGRGLLFCDFGDGDCGTRVICLSSVTLLFDCPPLPGTIVIREFADEGIGALWSDKLEFC